MQEWTWPGSRWWRVDLHAHTPASYDFGTADDRATPNWVNWLESAKAAGLHMVAIADHNTASAIDSLAAVASGDPGSPVILPGVELTASDGTHLLVVLSRDATSRHVEDILSVAQVSVDARGTSEARSSLGVEQFLNELRGRSVLAIGAHVNGPAGLLSHDGQQRLHELAHAELDGVEIDPGHPVDARWLDGSQPEVGRAISQVWGSDAHQFSEIGRRFTWVKMTSPSLEGLGLALIDGAGSLLCRSSTDSQDPNRHANTAIESISIMGARYMGRPDRFTLKFNPWMNAVIGGRGTGKSTVIDLMRLAFRREGELPSAGESSLRAAFDARMRTAESRVSPGLLAPETRVEIVYRKDGERFVVSWDQANPGTGIERIDGEDRVTEEGDIKERFPVRIYSQKQLFQLAQDPNALLAIIDETPEVNGGELNRFVEEARAKYLSLRAEARAFRAGAGEIASRRAALEDARRKLNVLQQGGHAATLALFRQRRAIDDAWMRSVASLQSGLTECADAGGRVAVDDLPSSPIDDAVFESLRRCHGFVAAAMKEFQQSVTAAVSAARKRLDEIVVGPDIVAWQAAVRESEQAYEVVIEELRQAGIENPDEYRDLLRQVGALEGEIRGLEQKLVDARARDEEANAELTKLRDCRTELTTRRSAFATSMNGDSLRLSVVPFALRGEVDDHIRDTLGIQRFDEDVTAMGSRVVPMQPEQPWICDGLDNLVARLRACAEDPQQRFDARDRRFEAKVREMRPEAVDRLLFFSPDDALEVSFRDPQDPAGQWKRLSQGSPGQQTAALLAFVLGHGREPIILDQPEDDLDNTMICQLLVRRLRETKSGRQVIVVTHNPNIVVHGDAEFVVSLESRSGQSHVGAMGGLQENAVRDEICRVMEGGKEAFEQRFRRIFRR